MAAPIGHLYLALKLLTGPLLHDIDQQAFIIGTSFPDIRYVAQVKREYTHVLPITLQEVIAERDPFKAGILFHSWVDKTHELFYTQHGIFNRLPRIPHIIEGFKCAEDMVLFPLMHDRSFITHFDTILPQEIALIPRTGVVKQWHNMLKYYLKTGPAVQTIYHLFTVGQQQFSRLAMAKNYIFAYTLYHISQYLARQKTIAADIMQFYQTVGDALEHGQEPVFILAAPADAQSLTTTAQPA